MKQVIPNLLQPSLNCLQNNLIFSYLYGNIPCDSYIILPYQQSFGGILVLVMDTETLVPFYCIDIAPPQGPTINDRGGAGGKIENGFIFSTGMPFENFFFPGEGPPRFFFSISSGPPPRSLTVVP